MANSTNCTSNKVLMEYDFLQPELYVCNDRIVQQFCIISMQSQLLFFQISIELSQYSNN